MLLLLHSAFLLSVVKLLLEGEVGVCALNSHGHYIVDHGKSWNCVFEFLWEPCLCWVFRQQEEMQHAVQNLGNTYTDDQINQLAQRHFENSQVFGAKNINIDWSR